jgi:hypothetical protein
MSTRILFLLLLTFDALILFYESSTLSISIHEVKILSHNSSFFAQFINTFLDTFSQNDFVLRTPMIIMHLISVTLIYLISKTYLLKERDALWSTLIFVLLPGIHSSGLLVDAAGLVLLLLLVYIYYHDKSIMIRYFLLFTYLFIDASFSYLYLGLFFFALIKRDNLLLITSLLLFSISMYYFGFDDGGVPFGYFLDNLGIYAVIFSPPIFIYMIYTLYRRFILREIELLLILSSTALVLSLLFSIRQNVHVEVFAPFLVLSLPLMVETFLVSYRIRLKQFRKNQKYFFYFTLVFLVVNFLVVLFNKEIYRFLGDSQKHFAYRLHIAKELSQELNKNKIECISLNDTNMQKRLKFYGIEKCHKYKEVHYISEKTINVTISYRKQTVYTLYVSK